MAKILSGGCVAGLDTAKVEAAGISGVVDFATVKALQVAKRTEKPETTQARTVLANLDVGKAVCIASTNTLMLKALRRAVTQLQGRNPGQKFSSVTTTDGRIAFGRKA